MYKLERNGKTVEHIVMTGKLGYKIYQMPVRNDLVFDTKEQAMQVAKLLDADVVEILTTFARVA